LEKDDTPAHHRQIGVHTGAAPCDIGAAGWGYCQSRNLQLMFDAAHDFG